MQALMLKITGRKKGREYSKFEKETKSLEKPGSRVNENVSRKGKAMKEGTMSQSQK